jgi:serine/threonine protein kinase
MKQDLLELMKSKEPGHLDESEIKDIIYQTLLGLAHMHKYGYFHRDMKPENLLINDKIVKIADFGLAREIRSIPPYTEYVSTRYYRAPECILKSSNYNSPMDIWAVGCIMAEMFLHPKPLFYGQNEKEVLNKICSILGTPNHDTWAKGIQQANIIGLKLPNNSGTDLAKIIPNASTKAIEIMKQMLQWDPNKRPTAISLLNNPYFSNEDYNSYNLDLSKFFENLEKSKTRNEKNIDGELIRKSISLLKQSKGDDNNYLKILNDTDGLVKLLTQLKKEKIQDEKDYEKEVNKFGGNECDISNINYNGLDLTNLSINKSNNLFNQSLKITNMNNINLNNTKNNNNNLVDMDFSYNVTTIGNNSLKNSSAQNEQNDVNVQNTDTLNINEEMESESKIKEECNNYGENFEIKLKNEPISNRIRSARKFLEENESKFLCDKPKKIKSNDYIFKFDKEENLNPNKNDYLYLNQKNEDKELNEILEKTRKKMGVVDSDFIKNDFNFINNNSKGFKMFNDNEPLFFGSRRNHIPNLNNAWGI